MIRKTWGSRCRRTASFPLLLAAFLLAASAGLEALPKKGRRAAADQGVGELPKPQLLHAETQPTLRYPAASFSGWSIFSISYGWFDVTRNGIRYTPVEPRSKLDEGFEASSAEISDFKLQYAYLRFRTGDKKRAVFYVPPERWGSIHSGPGSMQAAASGTPGTASMLRAMQNFDQVLAAVKPPPPPGPQLTFQAEPATVEKGHAVALVWTSMNATSVVLEPGDRSLPTQGTLSLTSAESTTYTLIAKGPGGTQTAAAAVSVTQPAPAAPPSIILVEPSASSGQAIEVSNPTLKIRGVAMDSTGFPIVSINGTPANMKPQNAQATEFWFDPLALQAGENKFEIVAVNRAHAEARFTLVTRYTPPAPPQAKPPAPNPKALAKQNILDLLKNFVPSERVAELVRQFGLKFAPSPDDLNEIRQAGGQEILVDALRQAGAAAKTAP